MNLRNYQDAFHALIAKPNIILFIFSIPKISGSYLRPSKTNCIAITLENNKKYVVNYDTFS